MKKFSTKHNTQMTSLQTIHKIPDEKLPVEVTVRGWVKTCRSQGRMTFIELQDGSCTEHLQIVYPGRTKASTGCGLLCSGMLKLSPKDGQRLELFVPKSYPVTVYPHDPETPVAKVDLSDDVLRKIPHLRTKTPVYSAVARIRHRAMMAIHRWLDDEGFFCIHTPLITTSDCEGAGEAFRIITPIEMYSVTHHDKFFPKSAYLTVSGQLHVEASCLALTKVYTFGPTFRAEHSKTSRHLAEFWMVEPEMVCDTLDQLLTMTEGFVRGVVKHVEQRCGSEMKLLGVPSGLVEQSFTRMPYTTAIELLQGADDIKEPPQWGDDLSSEHEKFLTSKVGCVFVTHWPASLKSFYMKATPDCEPGRETVECMDLLVPGVGELIGGSMREEDHDVLLARMKEKGMDIPTYQWYLDLRKFGTLPHGGFGIGFERLLMMLTGKQARDTTQFPRTYRHCDM
jgi:asparaginyl-tRNA synthetase